MIDPQTAQLSWTNLPSGFSLEEVDAQARKAAPDAKHRFIYQFVTVIVAQSTDRFFRLRQTSIEVCLPIRARWPHR
jgi:hypothetical protein